MKAIFIITLLLSFSMIGKSQAISRQKSVTIFVDSVPLPKNDISSINPDNIYKIVAITNKNYPDGLLCVTLKDHKAPNEKKVSLAELCDKYIVDEDKSKPRIYVIDDKLLTDTTRLRVGRNQYKSIAIAYGSNTPYFKVAIPNLLLIYLTSEIKFILK